MDARTMSTGITRRYSSTRQLLDKLRRNRIRNLAALSAAGCTGNPQPIRCERCGLSEPVLFWTPLRCRGHLLSLRCPSGCETRLRYDLVSGTVSRDRDWREARSRASALAALLLVIVAYLVIGGFALNRSSQSEEVLGLQVDTYGRSTPAEEVGIDRRHGVMSFPAETSSPAWSAAFEGRVHGVRATANR